MIEEHDRVVLKKEVPDQGLQTGDVGTVIHVHEKGEAFEVEFVALNGETLALSDLRSFTGSPGSKKGNDSRSVNARLVKFLRWTNYRVVLRRKTVWKP
jgi:hypothetical protein